ncbi:MAG: ATP-binding cassette domain-containing protein [Thermodesulfobacteriota bacterium]
MSEKYLLEMKGITKRFGGVTALEEVDLRLSHHEILAVVGDNGAGKSTLMKIVSGAYTPDAGTIVFEGREVVIRSPQDSLALGIQMCYQDLALVNCLDIPSNLYLGRELTRKLFGLFPWLDKMKMQQHSVEHLDCLGISVKNINEKVKNLSGGQRQVIAISRAAFWGTKLVILDEPTAALGVKESGRVLGLIKGLKEKDLSVLVISHNLQHVFTIADRVLVLRRGRNAGDRLVKDTRGDEIVKMITGAEAAVQEIAPDACQV